MTSTIPAPAPTTRRPGSPQVLRVVVLLLAGTALAALTWFVLRTGGGQVLDEAAMDTVVAGRQTQLTVLSMLGYVSISAIIAIAVLSLALALVRGRALAAVAALAVLAGSNLTTQVLKHGILERVDGYVIAPNSFPSGHTTVVAGGVAALLVAAPRALRPLVVLGGSFAVTMTGASTVVAGWHRPSDVVGAVLVALLWTAAAALVVRDESVGRTGLGPWAGPAAGWLLAPLGAVAAGVVLVAIGVRPSYGWSGFVEAALVLTAMAGAIAVAIALMGAAVSAGTRR